VTKDITAASALGAALYVMAAPGLIRSGEPSIPSGLGYRMIGAGAIKPNDRPALSCTGDCKLAPGESSVTDSRSHIATSAMTLYPRLFMKLVDGRAGGVANVAYVPTEIGVLFSALTHDVKLTRICAVKLIKTHKLSYDDLDHIQTAVNEGYIFRGRKSRYLEFLYVDAKGPFRHYLLVLKTARYGEEIWLQTFQRSDAQTLRSRIKNQRLLRPLK
jgi:hypothetical protein